MADSKPPEDLVKDLTLHGQEDLLRFWDRLDSDERRLLLQDLRSIDLAQVAIDFSRINHSSKEASDEKLEPVPAECFGSVFRSGEARLRSYEEAGLAATAKGETAVLLLAGGQGTRLGVDYPKGMYDVGLPSGKTLYQLQAERIFKLQEMAFSKFPHLTRGRAKSELIPWYIMTSEATRDQTREFFSRRDYFGLKSDNVIVFEQNTIPCLDPSGKILMEEPHKVARAPDGNGGLYRALEQCQVLEDMRRRGVLYVHVYCVDNILVKMADPIFIGYCVEKGADCGAKVVEKAGPHEAVGVVCKVDGVFKVVEYSEISLSTAERRNPDGRLTFSAGNICNHFLSVDFLQDIVDCHEKRLPYHVANKKIPFVNQDGVKVKPTEPNGIKLEKFVFDVFPFAKNFACWEVEREEEFSPLKNGPGASKDSPAAVREALIRLHVKQLLTAGATFRDCQGRHFSSTDREAAGPICEISPLLSYAGEGLETIVQDRCFESPLHLEPNNNREEKD